MAGYLEDLIAHERGCETANCRSCHAARNVYELVKNLVFSEVVYPEMTIAGRRLKKKRRPTDEST